MEGRACQENATKKSCDICIRETKLDLLTIVVGTIASLPSSCIIAAAAATAGWTSCVTATPDFETLVTTKRMEAASRAIDGRMMFGRTEEACHLLLNGSSTKSQSKRK